MYPVFDIATSGRRGRRQSAAAALPSVIILPRAGRDPNCLRERKENCPMETPIHVVGLCGSLRGRESFTRRLLVHAMTAVAETGAETDTLDLAALDLPMCQGPRDTPDNAWTLSLRRRVRAGQGIVLATPEYHNSYSGALKNALDLLDADQLRHKTFGLLGIAGGAQGAGNALGHLRIVVRGVGGHCIPQQINLPSVARYFDGERLTDEETANRIRAFADALVRHVRAMAHLEAAGRVAA